MTKVCPTCATQHDDSTIFCPIDGAVLLAGRPESSLIGTIISDRYLVTALLGEGGMGAVYRAQHVKLPREAAIKVMHGNLMQDPEAIARFHREATAASKVEHESVARVFDFGETSDGVVYLAMEYLDGPTLKELLAQEGPLPIPRVAALVQQIAAGLEAAHRQGIVHRDLKADNVLVVPTETGTEQAKIVDFGIAKAIGAGERALTRTGFVVGTPEYMSPEQLLGEEVDHRSDVYALALLAYHLLTGDMPFDSRTPDRGLMARLTSEPRPLELVRPDAKWPDALQAVLNRAMHRDREKRTPSAAEFARAFDIAARTKPPRSPRTPARSAPPALPVAARARSTPPAPPVVAPVPTLSVAPRSTPARSTPVRPPEPVVPVAPAGLTPPRPHVSVGPSRRRWPRLPRLPHLPIARWTFTALVIGFAYLVLTEGSVNRAVRKARSLVQKVERQLR